MHERKWWHHEGASPVWPTFACLRGPTTVAWLWTVAAESTRAARGGAARRDPRDVSKLIN